MAEIAKPSAKLPGRRGGPTLPFKERVARALAAEAARRVLPGDRDAYLRGLNLLCIGATHGLAGIRAEVASKLAQIEALPRAATPRWVLNVAGEPEENDSPVWGLDAERAAAASLNELRKAFAVAAYHHWERSVSAWWHAAHPDARTGSGQTKATKQEEAPRGFKELARHAGTLSAPPDPTPRQVATLSNALKHNSEQRWHELKAQWPELIAHNCSDYRADWTDTLQLTDAQLLQVFQAVQRSGPRDADVRDDGWAALPFTPRDDT